MHVILSLSLADLVLLTKGERVEAHTNVFIELERPCSEEELREVSRAVRKSSPKVWRRCPSCGNNESPGFVDDRCCRMCEGAARLLARPNIFVGDTVVIKTFVMTPWGHLIYPRPTKKKDRIQVPHGTTAHVIRVESEGDDPWFEVDCVVGERLYRLQVEGQYIRPCIEETEED
jgi:hypothetical protein